MDPDTKADRLYMWSMGLLILSIVLFATPAGPVGLPIAAAGLVCGFLACRS